MAHAMPLALPRLATAGLAGLGLCLILSAPAGAGQDWRIFADEACLVQDVPWFGSWQDGKKTFRRVALRPVADAEAARRKGGKAPHARPEAEALPYGPAMRLCGFRPEAEAAPPRRT